MCGSQAAGPPSARAGGGNRVGRLGLSLEAEAAVRMGALGDLRQGGGALGPGGGDRPL